MLPPISCSVSSRPVRVGFISTFSIRMSEPGTISPATSGKPADDGSPGTAIVWPLSLPWPSMRMCLTPSRSVSTSILAPKPFSIFSVWSRVMTGSITVVTPRRVQAGEQHRRLHLRRGHRHAVADRRGGFRSAQRDRHAVAGRRLQHLHAHFAQRIEHAAHRPLRQRGVADEGRFHVVGADQTDGETRAGAGIAEIERRFRLEQRAVAGAADHPFGAALLDLRAHRLHRSAGAHDVLALEQAGDAGLAGGQAAEHEGAVRDRFVARHAGGSRERR